MLLERIAKCRTRCLIPLFLVSINNFLLSKTVGALFFFFFSSSVFSVSQGQAIRNLQRRQVRSHVNCLEEKKKVLKNVRSSRKKKKIKRKYPQIGRLTALYFSACWRKCCFEDNTPHANITFCQFGDNRQQKSEHKHCAGKAAVFSAT